MSVDITLLVSPSILSLARDMIPPEGGDLAS